MFVQCLLFLGAETKSRFLKKAVGRKFTGGKAAVASVTWNETVLIGTEAVSPALTPSLPVRRHAASVLLAPPVWGFDLFVNSQSPS